MPAQTPKMTLMLQYLYDQLKIVKAAKDFVFEFQKISCKMQILFKWDYNLKQITVFQIIKATFGGFPCAVFNNEHKTVFIPQQIKNLVCDTTKDFIVCKIYSTAFNLKL